MAAIITAAQDVPLISASNSSIPTVGFNMKKVQKGHVTLKWYIFSGLGP